MSTEIQRTDNRKQITSISPVNIDEAERICNLICDSSLKPPHVKTPADAFVILSMGADLGLTPMQAMRGIVAIQGKPFVSSDVLVGAVLRSGLAKYFEPVTVTDAEATFITERVNGRGPHTYTYTMKHAAQEGLTGKDNWKRMPSKMLAARAKAHLARLIYPEVTSGMYDPSEADFADREVATMTVVPEQVVEPVAGNRAESVISKRRNAVKKEAPVVDADYEEAAPAEAAPPAPAKEPSAVESAEAARKYIANKGLDVAEVQDHLHVDDLVEYASALGDAAFREAIRKACGEMLEAHPDANGVDV